MTEGGPRRGPAEARAVWFSGPREVDVRTEAVRRGSTGRSRLTGSSRWSAPGPEIVVYRGEATSDDPMPLNSAGSYDFPIKYGYQVVGRVAESRDAPFPTGTGSSSATRTRAGSPSRWRGTR